MQDAKGSCGKVSCEWLISQGSEISLILGRRIKFSAFCMVRIAKECVSWCLGLKDLAKCLY